MPAAKGMMLRFMALAALPCPVDMGFCDADDVVVVLAGADDGVGCIYMYMCICIHICAYIYICVCIYIYM